MTFSIRGFISLFGGLLLACCLGVLTLAENPAETPATVTPRIAPVCAPPALAVVTGIDSATVISDNCRDLGTVIVNRTFTRSINARDGIPPYSFAIISSPANTVVQLSIDSSGKVNAKFRAPVPATQSAPFTAGNLRPNGQRLTFDIEVRDDANTISIQTFCVTVNEVKDSVGTDDLSLEDATDVLPVITPNSTPSGFAATSADASINDLPTGLQSAPYWYQLHTNGGTQFGGDVSDPASPGNFSPIDANNPDNFPGGISADTSSNFAGTTSGQYTLTVDDVDGDNMLDLVVTCNVDPGMPGSASQTFLDVFDANGVPTVSSLAIGSLGVRVNLNTSSMGLRVNDGDRYFINVTALNDPILKFALAPDSTPLPDGLRLDENGEISGTPQRSGDFTFLVQARQFAPLPDGSPVGAVPSVVLHTTVRQYFIRIDPAPTSSQFVLDSGNLKLRFGAFKGDSFTMQVYLSKDVLNSFDQLRGSTFEMRIGDPDDPFVLTEHITDGVLRFGVDGRIDWPRTPIVGEDANIFKQDARVLIKPLNPNTGLMRIFVSRTALIEKIGAQRFGASNFVEVPINIQIANDTAATPFFLDLDEIVSFEYRRAGNSGRGRILNSPLAATDGVGQFMAASAKGNIAFDTTTGSDTLNMQIDGYMRRPNRVPFEQAQNPLNSAQIPNSAILQILLGSQCGYVGTFGDFLARGNKLVLSNSDSTIPVSRFVIDNKHGRFKLELRAPATNAGTIKGEANGFVISRSDPFGMNVRIRIFDQGVDLNDPSDDEVYFDGQHQLILFRKGGSIGLK